jgi:hypothetical protein
VLGRRKFVVSLVPFAGAAIWLPGICAAQEVAALTEADPMAKAMGFVADSARADQSRYPNHAAAQSCAGCLHFTRRGADSARCDIFGKAVPKGGWCSGFSRRP